MSNKPIFVATHPRSCSTAFERVFMTRKDALKCIHEPFGDAYYYGPERLAKRFSEDEQGRVESGFSNSTYRTILDRINDDNQEGKRLFIKDMAQYLMAPSGRPVSIAPSLLDVKRGVGTEDAIDDDDAEADETGRYLVPPRAPLVTRAYSTGDIYMNSPYGTPCEPGNPTVVPSTLLKQFHFVFLIRHPRNSVPSYYRCTIPPLDDVTGFHDYRRDEAGYDELRRFFEFLKNEGYVGPQVETHDDPTNGENGANGANGANGTHINGSNGTNGSASKPNVNICVIDADDMLDHPEEVIETFCKSVGINYSSAMLHWDTPEELHHAKVAFEKWRGFHEDAINSTDLKPRQHKVIKSDEEVYQEWVKKFGAEAAELIKKSVEENMEDYEYLKQFAIKV